MADCDIARPRLAGNPFYPTSGPADVDYQLWEGEKAFGRHIPDDGARVATREAVERVGTERPMRRRSAAASRAASISGCGEAGFGTPERFKRPCDRLVQPPEIVAVRKPA
jgi:hypothetical protein